MNRAQRRAEEARVRAAAQRHTAVSAALAYMVEVNDSNITGCTILTPTGETLYIGADTGKAMQPGAGNRGRPQ